MADAVPPPPGRQSLYNTTTSELVRTHSLATLRSPVGSRGTPGTYLDDPNRYALLGMPIFTPSNDPFTLYDRLASRSLQTFQTIRSHQGCSRGITIIALKPSYSMSSVVCQVSGQLVKVLGPSQASKLAPTYRFEPYSLSPTSWQVRTSYISSTTRPH